MLPVAMHVLLELPSLIGDVVMDAIGTNGASLIATHTRPHLFSMLIFTLTSD